MDCSTEYDHSRPYIVPFHPNSPSPQDGSIEVNRWKHRPSEARFHTTCSDPLLTRASVRGRLESSITASAALVAPMPYIRTA
eukprot:scaffold30152_cov35-Phaeocystis_antarctica.AAC.1